MDARNVVRHFHKTLALVGVERHRFHHLRHTAATLLLARILGQSQISTTMDIYSHVMPSMMPDVARKMDVALKPVAVKLAIKDDRR